MTKALPFTQAGLRRAIAAAEASGLRVIAIRPDGTVYVDRGETPLAELLFSESKAFDAEALRWGDD